MPTCSLPAFCASDLCTHARGRTVCAPEGGGKGLTRVRGGRGSSHGEGGRGGMEDEGGGWFEKCCRSGELKKGGVVVVVVFGWGGPELRTRTSSPLPVHFWTQFGRHDIVAGSLINPAQSCRQGEEDCVSVYEYDILL